MRRAKGLRLATLSLGLLCHTIIARSDPYILGALGTSDAAIDAGVYGVRHKHIGGDDSGFAVGVGYEFSDHFSLEAAYQDFGKLTGDRNLCARLVCTLEAYPLEAVDVAALVVSATGSFRIGDRLDGYGRLGLGRWEFDSPSSVYDGADHGLAYGAGLRWSIDDWTIFAEYTRADIDIDTVGIGIRYGF